MTAVVINGQPPIQVVLTQTPGVGAPGVGLPAGGTTGQVAAKASNADYDIEYIDAEGLGDMLGANNLSDVDDPAAALANIGGATAAQGALAATAVQPGDLGSAAFLPAAAFDSAGAAAAAQAASQPLDDDLTTIAAIADAQGDLLVRGATGWERLPKSATATDVLTAGASQPSWAAPAGGGGGAGGVTALSAFTKIGKWSRSHIGDSQAGGVASLSNLNRLVWGASWLSEAISIDRLAISVQTAGSAGAVLRLGIWAPNSDGWPGALIVDAGTVSSTSTGIKEAIVAADLPAGLVWFGVVPQVATCNVHSGNETRPFLWTDAAEAYSNPRMLFKDGVSGALPNPGAAAGYAVTNPQTEIIFMYRRSA